MNTESDTPTPRTDAYERHYIETGNVSKLINLARDLERELAEVAKQRDHYKSACDQYSEDEMLCKLREVTKQRDALAEALRNYMSHHRRYGFVTLNEVLDAEQALRATKGGSYDS
jgi:primase-polymerase (primpol)-like protein